MTSNYKRWIAAAGPLVMACTVCAQGKVTDVATMQVDGGLAVRIKGSDLPSPKTRWDNGALVLNFGTTKLHAKKGKTWWPKDGGIKAVSYAPVGHTVDVAVRPTTATQPHIAKMEDGWIVYFEEDFPSTIEDFTAVEKSAPKSQKVKKNYQPAPVVSQVTKAATAATQPPQPKFASTIKDEAFANARVSLNFVNTDIVQILKALALQGNVNIAMGPDVVGRVTVNLDNVTVREALDLVTTLGGVRYAQTGSTFVVASTARFADMMGTMNNMAASETRVVPLFSREGNQIKAAILKSVPASTAVGKYELNLPSEKLSVEQTTSLTPGTSADAKEGDKGSVPAPASNAKLESKSGEGDLKDDYIVVIGTPSRLDAVEGAIRGLDNQICAALNIKVGKTQGMTRKVYEPQGIFAADLVKALAGDQNKDFNGVSLFATPQGSASRQAIVLSGREADVDRVMSMLLELDTTPDSAQTSYEVVGLKYIQPGFALSQLMKEVPGLKVSILPPPIDPRVALDYKETSQNNGAQASGPGQDSNAPKTGDDNGSGGKGGSSDGGSGKDNQLGSGGGKGADSVKVSTVSNSIPMKLLLRGSADQIAAAENYLKVVDTAPKQVAVELRVMELSREEALKVGLDWSVLTGGTLKSIHINQGLGSEGSAGGLGAKLGFAGGGSASITGALDQLSTRNNVLARPSILVNDGVPTNIFVGDEVRYVKSILTSANNPPTIETDEIDVGVDFNVIARVGDDHNIIVDLAPTLKILQGFTAVPGGGSLPQTSRRSAATQMTLKSGETIAIGGLIQDQDRKSYGGIPILKDLPIIGRIFGRTETHRLRSEVVFFVTVKEVTEADRSAPANPRQAEKDNTQWPGGGPDVKKNGKG